mgnify:CR=1 FL=1
MNFKQKVIRTASKMYGISLTRSSDLVESAFNAMHKTLTPEMNVREEDVLLFVGRLVLPCVN